MIENTAYMELQSFLPNHEGFSCTLNKLTEAMSMTSVRGFGWSVGLVMNTDEYKPKAFDGGIQAIVKTDESLDNWTLNLKGDLYILQTLFEDRRDPSSIFFDTRLVRTFEAFARTVALYKYLGVSKEQVVKIKLTYGGVQNRKLSVANTGRFMPFVVPKVCSVDKFSREIEKPLSEWLDIDILKTTVFDYCYNLFQLFDCFELQRENADIALKEHRVDKGVQEVFNIQPNP